jgi:hypothetical protein
LQRTLSDEARALAGSRGSLLASRWFDAKAIAERLSESWLDLLATRGVTKPVISGILSETRTFDLLQDLYEKRVPFNLRKDASPLLQRKEIKHDRLNQFTLLTYGFTPFSENAHSPRPRYYAHRSISAIAITPNRKSDTVRLVLDFRKGKVDENSAIRIWTHAGEVEFTKKVRDKRLVLEFQASGSEFLIYQPIWYRGKNDEKIFFAVSDVIVKPRSSFDQSYAESISRGKEALKLKKERDLVELAVKAGEIGDHGQCVKHLEELLKAYPKKSLFLRALAEAQLQVGNPSAAVDALRRAHAVSAKKAAIDRRIREISRPSLVRRFLSGSPFPIAEIRKVLNPK